MSWNTKELKRIIPAGKSHGLNQEETHSADYTQTSYDGIFRSIMFLFLWSFSFRFIPKEWSSPFCTTALKNNTFTFSFDISGDGFFCILLQICSKQSDEVFIALGDFLSDILTSSCCSDQTWNLLISDHRMQLSTVSTQSVWRVTLLKASEVFGLRVIHKAF